MNGFFSNYIFNIKGALKQIDSHPDIKECTFSSGRERCGLLLPNEKHVQVHPEDSVTLRNLVNERHCHHWVMSLWMNYGMSWIRNIDSLFLMIIALFLGVTPWSNIMEILEEKDGVDTELLVYAMTLVNKVG